MSQKRHYDILVIGMSGTGKSAVCNTLLAEQKFAVGHAMALQTTEAQSENRHLGDNTTIRVIDTPCVDKLPNDNMIVGGKVQEWKNLMENKSPSMVLYTVSCAAGMTGEQIAVFDKIKAAWGEVNFGGKLVVAFTFHDHQDKEKTIQQVVDTPPPNLKKVLEIAKNRHVVFSNDPRKAKDVKEMERQAEECFKQMRELNDAGPDAGSDAARRCAS